MRPVLACLALSLAAVMPACSASTGDDDDTSVSTDALVEGHGGITGPVDVQEGRLVVQRAGNEGLLTKNGSILVGKAQGSENPYGFLRRAVSAEIIDEDHIAITTAEASLADAVRNGAFRSRHTLSPSSLRLRPQDHGPVSNATDDGLDIQIGETPLLDWQWTFHNPANLTGVRDIDIARRVTLTHAEVHFAPTIDLSVSLRDHQIDRFDAIARGALDVSFDLVADTTTSVDLSKNPDYHDAVKAGVKPPAVNVTLFETEPYVLPMQLIGWMPVMETVRFRVVLECDIDLDVATHLETGGSLKSSASFGARFQNGEWSAAANPSITGSSRFAMTAAGAVSGMCDVRTEVGFFFYDLAGPTLSLSPYVTFDVAAATSGGLAWSATPGLRGALGGRVQVLGKQLTHADVSLFDVRSSNTLHGSL